MNNKEYAAKYYSSNRDRLKELERRRKYKSRYGITYESFMEMVDRQNSCCLICKTQTKLHLDHCHETGRVRGALCYGCNNGLGCFKDDPARIENALNYLRNGFIELGCKRIF